jgi:hypothetical protein
MSNAVSIGSDGELYPQFSSAKSMNIIQIETVRHGANLHNLIILDCSVEDGFQVYGYWLTLSYKAAGRVGNHVNIGILYGGYYPSGHLLLTLVHGGMNGSNHYIQFG